MSLGRLHNTRPIYKNHLFSYILKASNLKFKFKIPFKIASNHEILGGKFVKTYARSKNYKTNGEMHHRAQ